MEEKLEKLIAIPFEEYKELLIIKGKYEEAQNSKLIYWDERKEDGATTIPQKAIRTTDTILNIQI